MSTFIQDNAISTIIKMIDDEITKDTLNLHSPTMFLHMEKFYVMENKISIPYEGRITTLGVKVLCSELKSHTGPKLLPLGWRFCHHAIFIQSIKPYFLSLL